MESFKDNLKEMMKQIFLILLITFIFHELGHIFFQVLFRIPIDIYIDRNGFHTSKDVISMIYGSQLQNYKIILLYISGFVFSLLPLMSNKFKRKMTNLSKMTKKSPYLFYYLYLFTCLSWAFLDFRSLFYIYKLAYFS